MTSSADRHVIYAAKPPLCRNIGFVDGITRSGKFLTCRLLSHLRGGEHAIYDHAAEHLCYLYTLGAIHIDVAAPFLQFDLETTSYNRIIGRDLNTRSDDASNIFKCPDHPEYLARAQREGGMTAVDRFNNENRMMVFHTHNAMPALDMMVKGLPWMKMLHISRHPVDLSYKWIQREWGIREASDPVSFVPLADSPRGAVPWFANDWAESFLSMNAMERAVESVILLQQWDDNGYNKLSDTQRAHHVHRISFEELMLAPKNVIADLETFFSREAHPAMDAMLEDESLPFKPDIFKMRRKFFDEIRNSVSKGTAERLAIAASAYEDRWGLLPF